MAIDDPPVDSSSGFQNAEKFVRSSDEDLKKQSVPRVRKKRNAATCILFFFSLNLGFIELFFDRLSAPSKWSNWPTFVENREGCKV
ncbi:hypothetical protein NPIL_217441 [Nephila pilipes]|uniref:Uncharacterized protein n=1 Tax=Nephila pilipes TaxID=299642 RepID=A0A8X6QP71_NEPPI|nr:hypothetical protein NPIL_217441 [Nephila pilipes]